MPVAFPLKNATMFCPHCREKCMFGAASASSYNLYPPGPTPKPQEARLVTIDVRYCMVCGGPILASSEAINEGKKVLKKHEMLYPLASTREFAPEEVKTEDPDIAKDYDEAVACEAHSPQAAVMLLSRCASQILVAKCGAKKKDYLKNQFSVAIQNQKLPQEAAEEYTAAGNARNLVGHVWYDADGSLLKATGDDADWWFGIIDFLFENFYVAPRRRADRINRIKQMKEEKKAGDKQQSPSPQPDNETST